MANATDSPEPAAYAPPAHPYAGDADNFPRHSPFGGDIAGSLFLVSSNVASLPAIILACHCGFYPEMAAIIVTSVVSIIYHLCASHIVCLFHYGLVRVADHIAAWTLVIWIVLFFIGWRLDVRTSILFFVNQFLVLFFLTFIDEVWLQYIVIGVLALAVTVSYVRYRHVRKRREALAREREMQRQRSRRGRGAKSASAPEPSAAALATGTTGEHPDHAWYFGVLTWGDILLALVLVGLSSWAFYGATVDNEEQYYWRHSLWHAGIMLAMTVAITSRDLYSGMVQRRPTCRRKGNGGGGDEGDGLLYRLWCGVMGSMYRANHRQGEAQAV